MTLNGCGMPRKSADDLDRRYRLLRRELDAAYQAPVWDSERIDRIADQIISVARELASLQARGIHRRQHDRA